MSIITIEIIAQQAAPLDPTDPVLNPANSAITIDRSILNTIRFVVPPAIPVGKINLSTILLGVAPVQQGQPMLLIRATLTSQGGAYAAGDQLTRLSPVEGAQQNQQIIQDLSVDGGQYLGDPLEFPIDHVIGLDTTGSGVAGPHRIVLVSKFFEDQDAFAVA